MTNPFTCDSIKLNLIVWLSFINIFYLYNFSQYFSHEIIIDTSYDLANSFMFITIVSTFISFINKNIVSYVYETISILFFCYVIALLDYIFMMDFNCSLYCQTTYSYIFMAIIILITIITSFVIITSLRFTIYIYFVLFVAIIYIMLYLVLIFLDYYDDIIHFHHWQIGLVCTLILYDIDKNYWYIVLLRTFYFALFIHGIGVYGL